MAILPLKAILAIAAVVDIAVHSKERPVSAKALAARHALPPRHLEPVLQALVRHNLLRGIRGPGGGYSLACAPYEITAEQILRAAGTVDEERLDLNATSSLVRDAVCPILDMAEQTFAAALTKIRVSDMVEAAEGAGCCTRQRA
jgi:Rrf2 family transcriptional regulator, iron-sulfur cluster assembly transcription factor